jgi:hypothetical protein
VAPNTLIVVGYGMALLATSAETIALALTHMGQNEVLGTVLFWLSTLWLIIAAGIGLFGWQVKSGKALFALTMTVFVLNILWMSSSSSVSPSAPKKVPPLMAPQETF